MPDKFRKKKSNFATTLVTGIGTGTGDTITLNSTSGLPTDTEITLTFNRVTSAGAVNSTSLVERITGTISGSTFTSYTRGVDNTTEQAHAGGTVVEYIPNAADENDLVDGILVEHNQDGTHKFSAVVPASYLDTDGTLAANSDTKVATQKATKTYVDAATANSNFWNTVPGAPTRVSDTQFTITDSSNANKYDLLFKKGTVLKWLESSTVNIGMVISSSYNTDTVVVNIVGDSLSVGFTTMKYCSELAMMETFIIPGTLSTGTDLAKTWYVPCDICLLSADAYVKTAGTTNSTVFDINDDGTTRFTIKPTITTGTTSDIDNVADTPTTEVVAGSLVTVDIDSVSTTAPVEAYIDLFYIPRSYLFRS
jgi:hypothetical protein